MRRSTMAAAARAGLALCLLGAPVATADTVPPHLAALAGQVYAGSADAIDAARKAATPQKRAIIDRASDAFKRAQVANWRGGAVALRQPFADVAGLLALDPALPATFETIKELTTLTGKPLMERLKTIMREDASRDDLVAAASALDRLKAGGGLATDYSVALETGDEIQVNWTPELARLVLSARREAGDGADYEFMVPGTTELATDPETGEPVLTSAPAAEEPPRALTAREIADRVASIFGTWENGKYVMTVTGGSEESGRIRRSKAAVAAEIETVRGELDELRNAKEFVWEHPESGELVRQERFRRLDDPWEYKGERSLVADADGRKAELEARLAALDKELKDEDLPPAERLDPVSFDRVKASPNARAVTVTLLEKATGCERQTDQAYFDGRRLVTRSTHRKPCGMNEALPGAIVSELIASWSPPWWLLFQASYGPQGNLQLSGNLWGMRVTYDGSYFTVSRIHDPYADERIAFSEGGGGRLIALGAAETAWP